MGFGSLVHGQSCPVPEPLDVKQALGIWKGAYSLNGEFIRFTLEVQDNQGELTSKVSIPKLKINNMTYRTRICDRQELHIKNTSANTSVEFIGRPKENGSMAGRVVFKQNDELSSEEVFSVTREKQSVASN